MAAPKVVALLLALVIGAEYTGWPILDQAAVALLVLLGASFLWSRWSLRGLGFQRRLASDRAAVGDTVTEHLEVSNSRRLPKLWLEVRDASTLPGHRASRALHVPGRATTRWLVETPCLRRGRFRLGPVTLRSGDPLGFFPRRRNLPAFHDVLVYPATVDVSGFRLPASHLSGGRVALSKHPTVTSTVAGIRDYVPGDPLNRISWTATARTGRMMTKEFDRDPSADLWIIVDLDERHHLAGGYALDHPAHREPVEPWLDTTEEYAVTIAASLAGRCLDEGRMVGLIATADHLEVLSPDRSHRQHVKILESLALVRADGHMPLAERLAIEASRFGRESSLVVITPSVDDTWVKPLAEFAARGVRATVALIEQNTFGPAPSSLMVVSALAAMEIPVQLVKYGESVGHALTTGTADARGGPGGYARG
ncbi:MAG TPA: DUF58 domain-containing protein [Thermomicrobiales bacterium]|nr:DUF58 domain-containing protein [Thermomicrobiales bacterium]